MKFKRIKALFLMLGMSLTLLIGCNTKADQTETTVETESETAERKVVLKEEPKAVEMPEEATVVESETEETVETETVAETEVKEPAAKAETKTETNTAATDKPASQPATQPASASTSGSASAEGQAVLKELEDAGLFDDPSTINNVPQPNANGTGNFDDSNVIIE